MQNIKIHIVLFLLACFIFPQVAISMHYVLTEHQSSESSIQYVITQEDLSHSCTYHLSSLFYHFKNPVYCPQSNWLLQLGKQNYCSLENYVYDLAFTFRLRGPPNTVYLSKYQNSI